ncbi:MAG: UDP-N-acetylglucosamine pyrophosphorylase [Acidobacteria bacterium]|nr:UDP-N-acetylglucosamine pyrophosphorylase [Acidobacteriota bacterium]
MNISSFMDRGVVIPCPEAVEIDDSIPLENIAPGVVLHSGSRIRGTRTTIGPGSIIGAEAPATVEDCQVGHGVSLKGGFFSSATFLNESEMGSGAHIRAGTLLEEQASGAHTVGLKQTIFLPFVTVGSLINFCDCLMAGGTNRKNHSEVGSSYIHFNFTPRQDKATASLIGDVPHGVMLDKPPIFLGGQGGLIGPSRIAYGTIIAAGFICRKDVLPENKLYVPPVITNGGFQDFDQALFGSVRRIVRNNFIYIGNLFALHTWYRLVRKRYMTLDFYSNACWSGALNRIEEGIQERIKQLGKLVDKLSRSLEISNAQEDFPEYLRTQHEGFIRQWPELEQKLKQGPPENTGIQERDAFLAEWETMDLDISYLDAVARIRSEGRSSGTGWLQSIVDFTASLWD